jgi:hypothetical protein
MMSRAELLIADILKIFTTKFRKFRVLLSGNSTPINNQIEINLQSIENEVAITTQPKIASSTTVNDEAEKNELIDSAPDAASAKGVTRTTKVLSGKMRGKQRLISLALPPELLAKVNEQKHKLAISRSAFIKKALIRALEAELK